MSTEKTLTISQNLIFTHRLNNTLIFHRINGMLCGIDNTVLTLLKNFEKPSTIQDVYQKNPLLPIETINSFIDVFIDRGFLVNNEINEIQNIKQQKSLEIESGKNVCVVQLVVSNRCNFKCKYCFTKSIYSSPERAKTESSIDNQDMTTEQAEIYIEKIIQHIKSLNGTTLSIQFFGGEPLMNWPVIKHVMDTFGDNQSNISIQYSIVTNGSLLTKQIADYFLRFNAPIILSFDSPKGNDRIFQNGKNSSTHVKEIFKMLQENRNRVVINAVLSKETFDYFDSSIVEFAQEYSISEVGILLDLNPEFYNHIDCESIVQKLMTVVKDGNNKNIPVSGYWKTPLQLLIQNRYFQNRPCKSCSAMGCQFSIEPDGSIYACKGSSTYFGSIHNIQELLQGSGYTFYANNSLTHSLECDGCMIQYFCAGFCPGPLEKKYGTADHIEPSACEVYRSITKQLILSIDRNEIDYFCIEN